MCTGIRMANGASASSTAFPGVMLILVSVVAPVALFKLLAFVDPGTSSGAAMRAGMASAGGLQGLLGGGGGQQGGTTSAASSTTGSGQSQGEAQSNEATASRFGSAMSAVGGGAGSLFAAGLGMATHAGAVGASVGVDEMNQTGVGDSSYYPDYQRSAQSINPDARDPQQSAGDDGPPSSAGQGPVSGPTAGLGAQGPTGGAGAGGSSGAAAAAEVPPVA